MNKKQLFIVVLCLLGVAFFGFFLLKNKEEVAPTREMVTQNTNPSLDSVSVQNNEQSVVNPEEEKPLQTDENQIAILLPFHYRISEDENPTQAISPNWMELYKENETYFLDKARYKLKDGFDECADVPTISIVKNREALLFIDYPKLQKGKIPNLSIEKDEIYPNEKVSFVFNNVKYTLSGKGKIIDTHQTTDGIFHNVEDYKLYLETNQKSQQLLLEEPNFNDTFVKLLFVGDIDQDNQLDFIFEANRNYEEKRVILFLSSKSTENEIVKKVSEIVIHFDC